MFVCLPLRDVEHVLRRGLVKPAAVDGPEAAEDPKQGALATAVGPRDQQVHALLYLKMERFPIMNPPGVELVILE